MTWGFVRRVLLLAAVLLFPVAAFAQEAVLTGTVTDSSGAVLPGAFPPMSWWWHMVAL